MKAWFRLLGAPWLVICCTAPAVQADGESDAAGLQAAALPAAAVADGGCYSGHTGPTLEIKVADLKDEKGQFRIELYGDDPEMFLEGKGRIYKYFAQLPQSQDEQICLTVPSYGDYGLLVIHDRDNDSKPDFLSDGFGLSTNPKLKLRRPKLEEALFTVSEAETLLEIKMQYVTGGKKKKRSGPRGK